MTVTNPDSQLKDGPWGSVSFPRSLPSWWQSRWSPFLPTSPLTYVSPRTGQLGKQGPRQQRKVVRHCTGQQAPDQVPRARQHQGRRVPGEDRVETAKKKKKSLNRKNLLLIIILFLSLYESQSTKSPPRGNYYQFCSTETDFNCPALKKGILLPFCQSACKLLLCPF